MKPVKRFAKRRDPAFMAFLLEQLRQIRRCDCGCGKLATDRAHLKSKGAGGDDRGNVVLLNHGCHMTFHAKGMGADMRGMLEGMAKMWGAAFEPDTP